jgi:hypothetical protein
MASIPSDASKEVLMGYQYALYRKDMHLQQVQEKLEERRIEASNSSRRRVVLINASHTNNERHHRRGSRVHNMEYSERSSLACNLESSFISVDEQVNIIPKTPEAVLMEAQTYLLTTQP